MKLKKLMQKLMSGVAVNAAEDNAEVRGGVAVYEIKVVGKCD